MQQDRCPFFILTVELLRTEIPVERQVEMPEKQAGEPLPQIVRNGILQRKERTYPNHNPSKKQYLQPYTLYKYQNDNRTEYYILRGTTSKELKAGLPSEETQEDLVHIDVENVKTGESKNSLYGQSASKGQLFYVQDEKKYFVYVDTNSTISKNSKWVEIPSDSK